MNDGLAKVGTTEKLAIVDRPIHDIVTELLHAIGGIKSTEEMLLPLVDMLAFQARREFDDFVTNRGIESKELEPDTVSYFVPPDLDDTFRKLRRRRVLTGNAVCQTPRALLVAMVSSFDAFLGSLLRAVFIKKPALIAASQRSSTFSDLMLIDSISDAREIVIEAEVESFLRDSHSAQFEWMQNRFDIPLTKGLESWPTFIELTQRRNLFVHCDGVVSKQYLSECRKHGVDVKDINPGDRLNLNPKYFQAAYFCLFEIAVKLSQVLWRKLFSDEIAMADGSLNEIGFSLLQDEEFVLAKRLFEFATQTLKKHSSSLQRRIFVVNRAIAERYGGSREKCEVILNSLARFSDIS